MGSDDDENPSEPGGASEDGSETFDELLRAVARSDTREPPVRDDLAGSMLGPYRIAGELGRGGMGVVYRAEDTRLGRVVALKVLPLSLRDEDERRRRFLREARAAAAINHPSIATLYEVGEIDGRPYLAMELVHGVTLRARIAEGPFEPAAAARVFREITLGVARAHEVGIVHRDLKPENVMLTAGGGVKVLDFGLAKLREPDSVDGESPPSANLTREGRVMGTPGYMSPEQATGKPVDARTDVYALGIVLHEMLTGELPGAYGSGRVVGDAKLAGIVARCLAQQPEGRWGDAGEIVAALDAREGEAREASTSRPASPRSARRAGLVALGMLALGGVAAALVTFRVHGANPRPIGKVGAEASIAAVEACSSSRTCAEAHGGAPWRCNEARHVCVEISSPDCKVLAEHEDLLRDDTVWFGGIYPPPDAGFIGEERALDLARQDFAHALGGGSALADGSRPRPIALVVCGDGADAARAARHLVDDVEVPAVVGFRRSGDARKLLTSVFLPARVLSFVTISQVTMLTQIPGPPDAPRLVWRSTLRSAGTAEPIAALIADVLEPRRRAAGSTRPFRVAVLRDSAVPDDYTKAMFGELHFNGKSALENGDDYREYVTESGSDGGAAGVVSALVEFAPDVIIPEVASFEASVLEPVEREWHAGLARPYYLFGADFAPEAIAFAGKNAERRHRFFGATNFSTTMTNAQLVLHYNAAHPDDPVTRAEAPQPSYDAFYTLAYALYALGDEQVSGPSLSRAIDRLLPPGKPVNVGPTEIVGAYETLRGGGKIDLNGAIGSLDFDRTTGESPIDFAILCMGVDAHGAASAAVESGLVYSAPRKAVVGVLRCR